MKCRICGNENSPGDLICSLCDAPLNLSLPDAESSAAEHAPEWKKEVIRKVRAYSERKKKLITPPYPETPEPAPTEEARFSDAEPEPVQVFRPAERPRVAQAPSQPLEIWAGDLNDEDLGPEEQRAESLYLARRAGALFVDSLLLVTLLTCGYFLISYWFDELQVFASQNPLPFLSFILGCHALYYVSFYGTSRQTPGQVLFSLELRAESSAYVPLSRILLRWGLFWLLHLLNLLPLLFGRKYLYLDLLSGTVIRSLRQ